MIELERLTIRERDVIDCLRRYKRASDARQDECYAELLQAIQDYVEA